MELVYHSIELIYLSIELVYRSVELIYLSIELVYRSIELIYLRIELVYRSIELIYLSIELVYRSSELLYRKDYDKISHGVPYFDNNMKVIPTFRIPLSVGFNFLIQNVTKSS